MGAPGATGEDAAMSYPQYQQPNWLGEGQASESHRGSPALAIMSAVVGLGIAGVLAWQTLDLLSLLGEARSIMPAGWTAMIISHFVIAGIVFIGAALVFARDRRRVHPHDQRGAAAVTQLVASSAAEWLQRAASRLVGIPHSGSSPTCWAHHQVPVIL
jgi:hypothetical protein